MVKKRKRSPASYPVMEKETGGANEDVLSGAHLKFTVHDLCKLLKESEEIEKFVREWEEKRANLEIEYKMDQAIIRTLHMNPSIIRSEKLKSLAEKHAKKVQQHERDKYNRLKDLKATLLAADVAAYKENGEDSHAVEDQNDSCGSSSSNQPSAGVAEDDTPSVQLVASQAPGHSSEIQIEPFQEQGSDLQIQDEEGQVDPISLQDINSENPPPVDAQINPEELHHDPMAGNQPDVNPSNEPLIETTCENDTNAPEHTLEEQQQSFELNKSTQNSLPQLADINMYDVQMASRMPNHGNPLQAEMERLCAVQDKFIKFHEGTKVRLKSDCDKEIEEMIAQIKLKYEAKLKEEETNFQSKKKEIDSTLERVVMHKMLAAAFRAKCQDLTPFGPGTQIASEAGLMQQLHRFSVQSSPGQPSVRQQTPPPPPLPQSPPPPPPLEIVHQLAALFSNTVNRPPPTTNLRPPPTITPNTRPPPTITPATRPPPTISPIILSARCQRAPAPHLRPFRNREVRSPAPHIRAFTTPAMSSSDFTPPYRNVLHGQPVTTPLNSQPPVIQQLPPLPPEASYTPPPPPPLPSAPSWRPPQPPPPQILPPQIPQIPTNQTGLNSSSHDIDFVDLTDIFRLDGAHNPTSSHDFVCLSDDD